MSMPRFLFYCFAIPIVAAVFLSAFLSTPCHGFGCWCLANFEPTLLMESFSFAIFLLLVIAVFFGPAQAKLSYFGLAPGYVGLYQFNVVVPNVAASNAVPLTFVLGSSNNSQTLYTAVQ